MLALKACRWPHPHRPQLASPSSPAQSGFMSRHEPPALRLVWKSPALLSLCPLPDTALGNPPKREEPRSPSHSEETGLVIYSKLKPKPREGTRMGITSFHPNVLRLKRPSQKHQPLPPRPGTLRERLREVDPSRASKC